MPAPNDFFTELGRGTPKVFLETGERSTPNLKMKKSAKNRKVCIHYTISSDETSTKSERTKNSLLLAFRDEYKSPRTSSSPSTIAKKKSSPQNDAVFRLFRES